MSKMGLNVITLFLILFLNYGNSLKCLKCSENSCNSGQMDTVTCPESNNNKCYLVIWNLKGKMVETRGCIDDLFLQLLGPRLKMCVSNDITENSDTPNKKNADIKCILCSTDECNQSKEESKESKGRIEKSGVGSNAYTLYYLTVLLFPFITL